MPGQDEPLCLLQPAWSELKHCIRDSLRHHALRGMEARRPGTFGGLGGGLDRAACRHGLRVAQSELEASLLRGLVAGATWTAERAASHRLRDGPGCPHCGAPVEDEDHALWACPEWALARSPLATLGGGCSPGNPEAWGPSRLATVSSQGGAAADVDHRGRREERRERVRPAAIWYAPGSAGGPSVQGAGPRGRRPGDTLPGAPQPTGPPWALPVGATDGPSAAGCGPPRDTLHAGGAARLAVASSPQGQPAQLGGAAAVAGGGGAGRVRRASP